MPLKNIVIIAVTTLVSLACYSVVSKHRYANLYAEAIDIVQRESILEYDADELFAKSVGGMLRDEDPYFAFFRDDGYNALNEMLTQEFTGVGVYYDVDPEQDQVVVLAPVPHGPADEAGLFPGDVLKKIDGEPVSAKNRSTVERLRGPVDSDVQVTVDRAGAMLDFMIKRRKINVESVHGDWLSPDGSWDFVLKSEPRIGYLHILDFGYQTTDEFTKALEQIAGKIDGLIIDLRRNGGGPLDSAIAISDLFLPEGKLIVETRGRGGHIDQQYFSTANQGLAEDIPIAILVDRNTASASEIVAACLQDHHRALIVGERTFGKGTVQNVITLEPKRSALKLTTASYWRPSQRNIDRRTSEQSGNEDWGVSPETELALSMSENELLANYRRRFLRDFQGIHEARGYVPRLSQFGVDTSDDPEETLPDDDEPSEWRDSDDRPIDSFVIDRPLKKAIEVLKSYKP